MTTVNPGEKPELNCLEPPLGLHSNSPQLQSAETARPGGLEASQGELCPLIPLYTARYSRQPARRPSAPATCCEHKRNKTNLRGLWFPVSLGEFQCCSGCRAPALMFPGGLTFYIETLKMGMPLLSKGSLHT